MLIALESMESTKEKLRKVEKELHEARIAVELAGGEDQARETPQVETLHNLENRCTVSAQPSDC